ncbi:glutaminase A [Romboutsia sp. 1001216sp1]|uniref:glutaminase A n=1 Tax=Romboutsia TaxID=1501226 RepID=UPI000A54C3E3|nr:MULTISPECIES: glutaminase A [Romboutsia]MDB8790315.1 glutaminase A [Romboutsia sp. 1001216sp1]MDB8792252.1 glutaminase A [Romboutsia sp. 1001216sp1]MDB8795546.1 glutaminase A [Romboutsia sp. 1001216sp1]MDB8798575.1 glutaminase A [Romboutsia sp. 1001216sp1]MDB8800711.1 glutaminase A [Romboutsia sp. 1001216sp1]
MFDLLNKIVNENKKYIKNGHVATYIPALAEVDENQLGVAIVDLRDCNCKEYFAGDYNKSFAIESTSKVIALIMAMMDNSPQYVFRKIGVEPSGFAFNSILNMKINNKPYPSNPFINAGAIIVNSLIMGKNSNEKTNRILEFTRKLTNNPNIHVIEDIYLSEKRTGDINRSLAYYMKGHGLIDNVEDVLDCYFRQCSISVTAMDLARIGAILANKGVSPFTGEMIIPRDICTIVKSIMVTCGLYDESGDFAVHIGIPAKSGVGGGILATVPNKMGIGVFGPSLDAMGNSVAGVKILQQLSNELVLDIFD